jgi:hypothetical protein
LLRQTLPPLAQRQFRNSAQSATCLHLSASLHLAEPLFASANLPACESPPTSLNQKGIDLPFEVPAYDAAIGQLLWSAVTGGDIESSPAVANGVVYVGSLDNNLYAFNASTGQLIWSAATGGGIDSSPAVADGVVYVGSHDGSLYEPSACRRLWPPNRPPRSTRPRSNRASPSHCSSRDFSQADDIP